MTRTRYATLAACAWLSAIAACSASGGGGLPDAEPIDAGSETGPDAEPPDGAFDFDAERPLVCGDAGLCETRLPKSDHGVPLSLRSVWVVSSNEVWSVTSEGYILRYDGSAWTTDYRTGHRLSAVWATPEGAWVGGEGGLVLHKPTAGAWTFVAADRTSSVRSIAGTSDQDVWFVLEDGHVGRFDGAKVTEYRVDVPGIRINAAAGRTGGSMYLAGYVQGPPVTPGSSIVADEPYVLEVTPSGTSLFNPALQEHKGFVPISISLTGAADERHAVFVLGYINEIYQFRAVHGTFGSADSLELRPVTVLSNGNLNGGLPLELTLGASSSWPPLPLQVWAHRWDDVVMSYSSDFQYWYMLRWNGNAYTHRSLTMGDRVAPRTVQGIHGNPSDMWFVGDGFALKGAVQ